MTFENGDLQEKRPMGISGTGTYTSKDGWTYEGQFVKARQTTRNTTQDNIVYEGTFKQDLSKCELNGFACTYNGTCSGPYISF